MQYFGNLGISHPAYRTLLNLFPERIAWHSKCIFWWLIQRVSSRLHALTGDFQADFDHIIHIHTQIDATKWQ